MLHYEIADEIVKQMKISNEFLAVALASFLALQGFLAITVIRNQSEIHSISKSVNHVKAGEPTLRALIEQIADGQFEIKLHQQSLEQKVEYFHNESNKSKQDFSEGGERRNILPQQE